MKSTPNVNFVSALVEERVEAGFPGKGEGFSPRENRLMLRAGIIRLVRGDGHIPG